MSAKDMPLRKSPNDNKDYRPITLANDLRVLLISDPDTDKSAASMVVNVGHFDDPVDVQGLAHFLEHMLFLGTEKFPQPDAYQKFISEHGGSHNAWTGTEHTNFFFDIDPRFFDQALDQFSQFFIAPLFSEEYVEKERQAIDSEYRVKLQDDIRRLYDVHKETVNPAHPFSKFSVGNKDTLSVMSAQALRQRLVTFHQQQYSANAMTLAVLDNCDLDSLEQKIRQFFSPVENKGLCKPTITEPLYLPEHQQHEIYFHPLKQSKKLIMSFALPGIDHLYRHKPLSYISMLLGHEGKGSLLSELKKRQLVTALSAGGGINGSNFKDYNVSVQLTEKGMQQQDDIIALTLSYIALIHDQGCADWRYQEKRALANVSFVFQEKTRALDTVSHLAVNMQHYPADDYVFGDYAMDGLEQKVVEDLCSQLNINNMRLVVIDNALPTDKRSKWYDAAYRFEAIDNKRKDYWQANMDHSMFSLPEPNPYIVERVQAQAVTNIKPTPTRILQRAGLTVWHKQDSKFKVPKGHTYIAFDSELSVKDTMHIAMTRLYVELFYRAIGEENYPAELAGLSYHLYAQQGGLSLHVSGLSNKQALLVDKLLGELINWSCNTFDFETTKTQMIQNWRNAGQNKSISQLFGKLGQMLQPNSPPSEHLADALSGVDFEQFNQFKQRFFDSVSIDSLIYGDWTEQQAMTIAESISTQFFAHDRSVADVSRPLALLPENKTLVRRLAIHGHDPAIVVYYQAQAASAKEMALFSLINHLVSPYFFHELRTQKQFGYIVGTGYVPFNRYPGIAFYIQSPTVSPADMQQAIDEFICTSVEMIAAVDGQTWQKLVAGLAAQWLEKDANLRVRSQRFWTAIANQDENFDLRERVVAELQKLTPQVICEFVEQRMAVTANPSRFIIYSDTPEQESDCTINGQPIENTASFIELAQIVL